MRNVSIFREWLAEISKPVIIKERFVFYVHITVPSLDRPISGPFRQF
jgi:hypothetical protein